MTLMWQEIKEQPSVLEKCRAANQKVIADLVRRLEEKRIEYAVIAARGTSDHAAVYGKYIMEYELGIPAALAAPSVHTIYGKELKLKNNLFIGISQSGRALDVLEMLRSANASGAVTVSITNDEKSPLAVEAQFHLYCNAGLEKSVAATKTFTSEMYILAQLVAEWSKDSSMKNELAGVSDVLKLVLEKGKYIKQKAQYYRYINDCFVLARGINYAIALETALKIQETAYVRAKAYSTSDFYHGPFAMVERGTPVLIYAPEGPSLKDMGDMTDKLRENDAELIVVSNNKDILKKGGTSIKIPPASSDIISPFLNVTVAQMFACQLALSKGLDPDSPRGLKKVTITR